MEEPMKKNPVYVGRAQGKKDHKLSPKEGNDSSCHQSLMSRQHISIEGVLHSKNSREESSRCYFCDKKSRI